MLDTDQHGCFPPNTLFRLKQVVEAGGWEAPSSSGVSLRPQQRLLIVTATYKPPRAGLPLSPGRAKLCGNVVQLEYGSRYAFIRGLEDLVQKPALTM